MKTTLLLSFATGLALTVAAQSVPPEFSPPPPATGSNVVVQPDAPEAGAPGADDATTPPVMPPPPAAAAPTAAPPTAAPAPGVPPGVQPAAAAQPAALPPGSEGMIAHTPPPEETIPAGTIDWVGSGGADLVQALDYYAKLTGRTVLRPANLKSDPIMLRTETALTKREAIQALDSVLALNGISMIPVGDKFVKAVPTAQAALVGAPIQHLGDESLAELGPYVTHTVQLQYVKPSELMTLLPLFASVGMVNPVVPIDASMSIVLRDNTENVKRMLELIKEVDKVVPAEFISEVIPIKYAIASDIASALSSLSSSVSVSSSGASTRSTGTGSTGGSSRFGMGGLQQGQPGVQPGTQPGISRPTGQPTFQERLQNIVKKASAPGSGDVEVIGPTKIVADERANSLLVFATRQDMETITNIVAKLDVVLPQVLIEAIIMDVSLSDGASLGVSYLQQPQQMGQFTGVGGLNNVGFLNNNSFSGLTNGVSALGSGLSYFGRFGQNFDATLTAAASDSRVTVIQKPRIMTFHAKPASFFIGNTVPYVTSTSYYGGYGGYGGPSSQFQQLRVGIGLQVTPYINQDGLVVMEIEQQIEEISGSTPITGVGDVPNTASRELSAQVAVKDGETIILGGFIRSGETKTHSGVPVLKDIPLLGFLFNSNSRNTERKELIVLMRPTVLRTPELAAATTRDEKLRLPGISEAEMKDNAVEERTAERMKRLISEHERARAGQSSKPSEPDKDGFRDVPPDWKPNP